MFYNLHIQTIYLIIAVIACSLICLYGLKYRQARGSRTFIIICVASIIWMSGNLIGRFNATFWGQWIGELVTYMGVMVMPVAVFVFTNQYCDRIITKNTIIKLLIIPVISWLVLFTNPLHHLFFSKVEVGFPSSLKVTYGLYFWTVHTPYSYILILASFAITLREISRTSKHFRPPLLLFFISMCIPFLINILVIFKVFGTGSFTPLSFPVFFLIASIAIYRFEFLGSNPIAYENVFDTIRDGVVIIDQKNRITDINLAASKTLRQNSDNIIGQNFDIVFSQWSDLVKKYENAVEIEDEVEIDLRGKRRFISVTITPLKKTDNTINGRIFTFRDITDRLNHQLALELLAFQDPLTGLANRLKFHEEAEITLEKSMISGEPFAVLYCDLDRFKSVNDTLGHQVGDELLKYVAARIHSVLRKNDLLARLGGDEFAVLLRKTGTLDVHLIVERILENVQMPFKVGDLTLIAELSIGAAVYPEHGENFSELLRHADAAMYQAKANGGGLALFSK